MGILFVVLAAGAAVLAIARVRKRWRFTDIPTSDAGHVFPGLSEVHGTVEPIGKPARAASDGSDCVFWTYSVQREQKDKNGSHWVTEESGTTAMPFQVRDASGAVRVVIDDESGIANLREIDIEHLTLNFLRPYARVRTKTYEQGAIAKAFGAVFGTNDPDEPISAFGGRWRAFERRLCVGDPVFVTGDAQLTPAGDAVEFTRRDAAGDCCLLEISHGDEKSAMRSFAGGGSIVLLIAVVLGLLGFAGQQQGGAFAATALAAFTVAVAVVYLIGIWNRVRRVRERGLFAWSLIDVACEQRSNLVPQLQVVVGAAMAHEREVLERVAAARGLGRTPSASATGTVRAADAASATLIARVEAYPDLKTQANTAQLMEQVRLLTDRVAFGRRFYNDSVLRLQNRLGQFPDGFIGRLAGVRPLPYIDDLDAPDLPPPVAL